MLSRLRAGLSRVHALLARRRLDADFDAELRSHADLLADDLVRRGAPASEARRQARLAVGNPVALAQDHRERRGLPTLESLVQDVRFALRLFRRRPGFLLIAVLTMALGIGVNTTVFSALNAAVFRPLPIAHADRAVRLERWFESRQLGNSQFLYSYAEYRLLRDQLDTVTDLVAVSVPIPVSPFSTSNLTGSTSVPDQRGFAAQLVSPNFFSDLGVTAQLGRALAPDELRVPGGEPVVFLSDACWRSRFGANPAIAGTLVTLNGTRFTIVGVARPEFVGIGNPPVAPDFWAPVGMKQQLAPGADWVNLSTIRGFQLVGHLAPSIARRAASARTGAFAAALNERFPDADRTTALTLEPAAFFGQTNDPRFALFVAILAVLVGLILLTACANLANMLLARAAGRTREIALRIALGAARGRVIRQLLIESVLLSLLGGAVAVAVSAWSTRLLWIRIAETVQLFAGASGALVVNLSPDARVFAFTLLVATLAGILFGLAPARQLSRSDVVTAIKDGDAGLGTGPRRSRLRSVLVAGQVGASMTLAITAGLLARGVVRAQGADAGYDTRHLYYVGYAGNADLARAALVQREIGRRLADNPAIAGTAFCAMVPFTGTQTRPVFADAGPGGQPTVLSLLNQVSASFFDTLGIPILRGRSFTRDEETSAAPVAIVSRSAAEALWPGRDPLGQRIQVSLQVIRGAFGPPSPFTVIGVVGDARTANISRLDPAVVYTPTSAKEAYALLVRSPRDAQAVMAAVRPVLAAIDPQIVRTLEIDGIEDRFVRTQRVLPDTLNTLAVVLAVLALGLAAAGIYGVVSFLASQRVREIGIRIALGATTREAIRLVLVQGLTPVAAGMAGGLLCALGIAGVLRAMLATPGSPDVLFGLDAFDPLTFVALTSAVLLVALAASAAPAWRAARTDPLIALRRE